MPNPPMRSCRSASPERLWAQRAAEAESWGRSARSSGRSSAPTCRAASCRRLRSSREASRARSPTRWSAAWLPISARRAAARWAVLSGGDLSPSDPKAYFEFIYPPLPAVLLAVPAYFGKIFLYTCLSALNAVAWWMTGQFSNAMTGSGRTPGPWLFALPGFATVTFVFDMFDLGQPNLILLAMMLFGFWLMQHQRPWLAGSMFALATAIKVFPVAVLPYLVWRRRWASAASMLLFVGIFLFVVPAPIPGFQHTFSEFNPWYQCMIGSSSEQGFGQRGEQNWSWVNQSIIAVTHRLTRPVNYNQDNPAKQPAYSNLVDLAS